MQTACAGVELYVAVDAVGQERRQFHKHAPQ